ncbi:MAG: hypothetical protein MZV63_63350 [Marinilabiliales bacterium]|nr:hypothetical protein [Marinilabiliales bacterium]
MKIRAGFLQFEPVFRDIERNVDTISRMLFDESFDLIVLPELCSTGYLFLSKEEVEPLAEGAEGILGTALTKIAKRKNAVIVAGFAEKAADGKVYNSAMTVTADGVISVYRKAHLFYRETLSFDRGDTPFEAFDTGLGYRLGGDDLFRLDVPRVDAESGPHGSERGRTSRQPGPSLLPGCDDVTIARESRVLDHSQPYRRGGTKWGCALVHGEESGYEPAGYP